MIINSLNNPTFAVKHMPTTQLKKRNYKSFANNLMEWHITYNKRTMPWKGEKNPYKIWISEIILQQTRVVQGLAYYNKFLETFPDVQALAKANDTEVFKLWEGLGYYSRCKNILFTARQIVKDFEGIFPTTYENILNLKGIGPYTAAAISSFAYGLPHAVLDGNVLRVLARYFGDTIPIDSTEGNRHFIKLANSILDKKNPAAHNQAIMDFGATICKPQIPDCSKCIMQKNCVAFRDGFVNKLPVKEKTLKKSKRWFYYFIFLFENEVLVNKREEKDIWQNLHEFYLYESAELLVWKAESIESWLKQQLAIKRYSLDRISPAFSQQLTHQTLKGQFFLIQLKALPKSLSHLNRVPINDLAFLPFPKFINQYLEEYPLPNR